LIPTVVMTLKKAKRLITAIIGFTVLAIGIAMIVLPGPAVVVIPVGLGILATEFIWAQRLLHSVKQRIEKMQNNRKNNSV
jgi:uncharacterized protein (TIGR02611 family)